MWYRNSEANPLDDRETTAKVVNLAVDKELLRGCHWLHEVQTAGSGAFVGHVLAVWPRQKNGES